MFNYLTLTTMTELSTILLSLGILAFFIIPFLILSSESHKEAQRKQEKEQ
jgi:hypothetical protein